MLNQPICEIKQISPFYQLFDQYKHSELMFTVTFFILLMYLEEFLFMFRMIDPSIMMSIRNVRFC